MHRQRIHPVEWNEQLKEKTTFYWSDRELRELAEKEACLPSAKAVNLVLFEAQGNARFLFAVQKIRQGGRYKRIREEIRARNAGVGGAAQADVESESEAEAHSDRI